MTEKMSSRTPKRRGPDAAATHPPPSTHFTPTTEQRDHVRALLNDYICQLDRLMTESYLRTARVWLADFCHARNETPAQRASYQALHTGNVEWFDHASQIHRTGVRAAMDTRDCWNRRHDSLRVKVKSLAAVKDLDPSDARSAGNAAVAEVVWKGRMAGDRPRTVGAPAAVRDSGKSFETHLCCVFRFDDVGKIRRIDEYHTGHWGEGVVEGK